MQPISRPASSTTQPALARPVAAPGATPAVGMGREGLSLSAAAQAQAASAPEAKASVWPRLKRELALYTPEVLNFAGKGAMFWGGIGLAYGAVEAVAMSQPLALVVFGLGGAVGGAIAHLAFGALGSGLEISANLKRPEVR